MDITSEEISYGTHRVCILKIEGEEDKISYGEIVHQLKETLRRAGIVHVIVDASAIENGTASSAIGMIVSLAFELRGLRGDLRVVNPQNMVRDKIHIGKLEKILTICETKEEALASFFAP